MRWTMNPDNDDAEADELSVYEQSYAAATGCLSKFFSSCSDDARGSVHRAWGVTLLFILAYFIVSVVELINLKKSGMASIAMMIACVVTGIVHLILGVVGTFVLKRFPTSFSVGFFIGMLVVLANQNLILFVTFHSYGYGGSGANNTFANLGFSIFAILIFFTLLLFHFKKSIVISPPIMDAAKGVGGRHHVDHRTDYSTPYRLTD